MIHPTNHIIIVMIGIKIAIIKL